MLDNTTVAVINPAYQNKLLKIKNINFEPVGTLFKVDEFDQHNFLVDINCVFSSFPAFGLVDRTCTIKQPVKYHVPRPWQQPIECCTLDQAAKSTVHNIVSTKAKINIMWSGGIDSTFVVTAFLKHHTDLSQIRILYSPWSTYEHPEYIEFLKKFSQIELIDISGDVYLNTQALDGCYIVGDGGDESHASLDESFFDKYGFDTLHSNWIDFFRQQNKDEKFIEFCLNFFQKSGKPIHTVLEARWWFYICCKFYGTLFETKWPYFLCGYDNFAPSRLISFFDNNHYQSFAYYNTDKIIVKNDYISWKQFLKDYCYEFDHLDTWWRTHKKLGSTQIIDYNLKKLALMDRRWLMLLNDGTRISTPNLPFFSAREFENCYGSTLDKLFNV